MSNQNALIGAVAAALLIGGSAEAQKPAASMPGMDHAGGGAAGQAMMDGMTKMNQAMSAAPMTGDPDSDFVAMMIPHHEGAIDMAEVELKYGRDPKLKRMAHDIVEAQRREIAEMRRWQAAHPKP